MRWVPIAEEDGFLKCGWSGRNIMNKVQLRVLSYSSAECSQVREISAKKPENVLLITCLSKNLTTRIEVLPIAYRLFRSAKI